MGEEEGGGCEGENAGRKPRKEHSAKVESERRSALVMAGTEEVEAEEVNKDEDDRRTSEQKQQAREDKVYERGRKEDADEGSEGHRGPPGAPPSGDRKTGARAAEVRG